MTAIVTKLFRHYNADRFKEEFSEASPSYLYLTIGRSHAWSNEAAPDAPVDTVANTQFSHWNDMIAAKKVASTDTSYVVARNNWTANTVYTQYTHTNSTLYSNTFFVMTDDFNVYKCLFNNGGANSTVKPTGVATSTTTTGDGYVWKYMYSVSAADAIKFVTDGYIPVKTLTSDDGTTQWDVQAAAVNGAIDIIQVTNGGTTFNNYNSGTVASGISNTVVQLAASASATNNVYNGSTFYIVSGTGAGLQSTIIDYDGATKQVTLSPALSTTPNGTSTYRVTPKVTITGDGTGCQAVSVVNSTSNTIHSVLVTSVGSGYTGAVVTLSANSLSGATATAYIGPKGGHGSDPVHELGGFNVMVSTNFDKDESGNFPTYNDFRKICLIKDPQVANGSIATASSYNQLSTITLGSVVGTFTTDEIVSTSASTATGRVLTANSTVMKIVSTSTVDFANTNPIVGASSGATANATIVSVGSLKKYSGEVMYVEQRGAISRAADQIETVNLTVAF